MLRNTLFFCLLFQPAASLLIAAEDQGANAAGRRAFYAIAIHGGAGRAPQDMSPTQRAARRAALGKALDLGQSILKQGGTSLDAVEQVIRYLEDHPHFNAGRGAVLNADGSHELDASIMDGSNKACGAVAGVKTVKNPISLARLVMTETRHVLLAAEGADRFAREMQVPQVDQQYFRTEEAVRQWKRAQDKQDKQQQDESAKSMGTVGCVALDQHGNLAAGTSTGGLTNKKSGRVGDSPIIGAGTYADNATCAVSCTGIGEHFIRQAVAYDVSALMAYKKWSVKKAVEHVLTQKLQPGHGGIIAVSHDGTISMQFNTPGMSRAAASSRGVRVIELGKSKSTP